MQAITAKAAGTLTWMTANAATWHFEEKKKQHSELCQLVSQEKLLKSN